MNCLTDCVANAGCHISPDVSPIRQSRRQPDGRFRWVAIWLMKVGMLTICLTRAALAAPPADNVILITLDGLRWQEVFGGADEEMMNADFGNVKNLPELRERFQRDTATDARQALMPFFWSGITQRGVVFGDPQQRSTAVVTNGLNFSYPGYSEILCGFPDPRIDSNSKTANPNVTVLEWIHQQPGWNGRVAAWCSWDVFPWIINQQRSEIPVNAGWQSLVSGTNGSPELVELNRLQSEFPHYWDNVRYDYFTFRAAEISLREQRPRLLYVSLGETDDWAHGGRYDLYLDAAWRADDYIRRLWETAQSLPQYRDRTALIITTDHGRGDNKVDWKSHGKDIAGCEQIWIAVYGAGVTSTVVNDTRVTQSQVASTVAAALGLNYSAAQPRAGQPLPVFATTDRERSATKQ
ncbi:MAG: alkaline phosphatase family protein [Planctomycetaceae bacterium]|nr:alkaline phosphatase family protein [Planctomycetaceae bacterium]